MERLRQILCEVTNYMVPPIPRIVHSLNQLFANILKLPGCVLKPSCFVLWLEMEIYQVEFVESQSGQLRKLYLYHGIHVQEVRQNLQTAFEISPIVGFIDEAQVIYPLSALVRAIKFFDGLRLTVIIGDCKLPAAPVIGDGGDASVTATAGDEAERLILTEDNAEKAFNILDKNGDGYLHKEEIVDILTVSYSKFLDNNPRFSFAYSCLFPAAIALATAQNLLSSVDLSDGDCSLDFDDFCAWYLSGGTHALRELMIYALEFISTTSSGSGSPVSSSFSMKRSKSRTSLNLSSLYADAKVAQFTAQCQSLLRLSVGGSLSYLLDLIGLSVKGRSVISHEMYTKVFYVYFLHQEYQLTERDGDILELLDSIFDMLSCAAASEKVHLLDLGSLLCAVSNGKYLQALKTLFDLYPDSHQGFVTENILANHLCQILRLIFYFNPAISEHTGCYPEDLACALSVKVLQLTEASRKMKHKLSFEEFVEAFLHALMLGLNLLQISHGYFYDYLERLMTYMGDAFVLGRGGLDREEDSDGEHLESCEDSVDQPAPPLSQERQEEECKQNRDNNSSNSGDDSESGEEEEEEEEEEEDGDVNTEAATAQLTTGTGTEEDTLDGLGEWED